MVSYTKSCKSLSARRAWIEMSGNLRREVEYNVALRKESVDRNPDGWGEIEQLPPSLSARRAWIEISTGEVQQAFDTSRSPQGERG